MAAQPQRYYEMGGAGVEMPHLFAYHQQQQQHQQHNHMSEQHQLEAMQQQHFQQRQMQQQQQQQQNPNGFYTTISQPSAHHYYNMYPQASAPMLPQHHHQQQHQQRGPNGFDYHPMPLQHLTVNAIDQAGPSSTASSYEPSPDLASGTWRPGMDDCDIDDDGADDGENGDQQGKTLFDCPHCDKTYRGKHARSIWRRHLQDKHGIPLSVQPRRTRWDADANRPKNAEERRERMLESKRRWARKKRAMDKLESKKNGDEEVGDDSVAEASASPAPLEATEPVAATKSAPPHPPYAQIHPQSLFEGNAAQHKVPPGPTAFLGGFGSPVRVAGTQQYGARTASSGSPAQPKALTAATPSRLMVATSSASQSMARSASTGSTQGTAGSNPFSLEHHKVSPADKTIPSALLDGSPSRALRSASKRPMTAAGVVVVDGNRPVLPPLLSTPMRSSMIRDGAAADSMFYHGGPGGSGGREGAAMDGSSSSSAKKSTSSSVRDTSSIDRSWTLSSGRHGRGSSDGRGVGGFGGSSDDDEAGREQRYSSSHKKRRGSNSSDGPAFGDDSGIGLMPLDIATPFHKSFSRGSMSMATGMTPGMGLGMTPRGNMSGLAAFPQTVQRRQTPIKRSRESRTSKSRNRDGKAAGGGEDEEEDDEDDDDDDLPSGGADQFSSPHHPNLAHSLGLAPQSALRSTGKHRRQRTTTNGNSQMTPWHSSIMTPGSGLLGMSLGFTPLEKSMASFGAGSFASPSVGFNSGFAWPESVRRPLASSNGNGSNKRSVGGDMSGLSSTKSAARRLPMSVIKKSAHFGDDLDSYDDDEVGATGRGQRSGGRGGSNSKGRRRRSGSNLDDDDDDEDDVVDKENRNYGLVDDTPSRPSGKHRPIGGGGSGGDEAHGGSGVADDLVPLRFNKAAKTTANVAATSAK